VPLIAWLLLCAATAQVEGARFPGAAEELESPDGSHIVRWMAPARDGGDHRLVLIDARDRTRLPLLSFPRHVDVSWSPSGARLALTNSWASDESTVLLWEGLTGRPRDLLPELAAHEGQAIPRWNAHHHVPGGRGLA
jgi:hypothetical protein